MRPLNSFVCSVFSVLPAKERDKFALHLARYEVMAGNVDHACFVLKPCSRLFSLSAACGNQGKFMEIVQKGIQDEFAECSSTRDPFKPAVGRRLTNAMSCNVVKLLKWACFSVLLMCF